MVELVSFEGELNFSQAAFGCIEYDCCSFVVLLGLSLLRMTPQLII